MVVETYSWVGVSAATPVVAALLVAVLCIFHAYRNKWRSVDLFLVSLVSHEFVACAFVFCFSVLNVVGVDSPELCTTLLWGLTGVATSRALTLSSLAVDRALTVRWPYRYRFSVRRSQIRYHLGVLAVIGFLVGVASTFAQPPLVLPGFHNCNFMPYVLDEKFAIFCISLHGALLTASLLALFVTQWFLCGSAGAGRDASELNPLSDTSTASTSTGTGHKHATPPPRYTPLAASTIKAPPTPGSTATRSTSTRCYGQVDFRWNTVVVVVAFSYLLGELPLLAAAVVGQFFPEHLPPWPITNLFSWLLLIRSVFLVPLLIVTDRQFRGGLRQVFSRSGDKTPLEDSNNQFHLLPKDGVDIKFPLTNGSLFSVTTPPPADGFSVVHNYKRGRRGRGTKMGTQEIRGVYGASLDWKSRLLAPPFDASLSDEVDKKTDTKYSGVGEKTSPSSFSSSSSCDSDAKPVTDDHIYATLSDDLYSDDMRCLSATTSANDDFEFHDTRRLPAPATLKIDSRNHQLSTRSNGSATAEKSSIQELFLRLTPDDGQCAVRVGNNTQSPLDSQHVMSIYRLNREGSQKLHKQYKSASLSMNDLDMFDGPKDDEETEREMTFVLPERSESTMSLYRLLPKEKSPREARKSSPFRLPKTAGLSKSYQSLPDIHNQNQSPKELRQSGSHEVLTEKKHKFRVPRPNGVKRSKNNIYKKNPGRINILDRYRKGMLTAPDRDRAAAWGGFCYTQPLRGMCAELKGAHNADKYTTPKEQEYKKVFVSDYL